MLGTEAIRTAQAKYGNKPLTGEQVRWGLENLDLTADASKRSASKACSQPIKVSCADHEGARTGAHPDMGRQEVEDHLGLVHADDNVIRPMVEETAAKYAAEKKITRRLRDQSWIDAVRNGIAPLEEPAAPPALVAHRARMR